jgi:HTH-type transcriptional regulator/antitoxin HigA
MSATIKKDAIAGKATRGVAGVSAAKNRRAAVKNIHAATKQVNKPADTGRINNNKDYDAVMKRIDELVEIPDNKLTKALASELHRLAKMAQAYEKTIYTIKPPSTFEGVLEMKMYELKLTQGKMAKRLKVSDAKFSLILSGKQQPDIKFLKTVHDSLGIDGNYLLSVL